MLYLAILFQSCNNVGSAPLSTTFTDIFNAPFLAERDMRAFRWEDVGWENDG
ncbi:hypothetical protein L288_04025 [Sphingobium quisquiliarum P25]|uniref:Uncharacterized protein n=1 Tax=Sphingobium quisquiliarum P25 TaxID=1329909 RepID=T0HBS1_9SPHN|nr:hypothetical protein L288_04025 [Sphingobium quisquiliarum P25]